MGKRDHREVRSRLVVLVMHLLKWQLQPEPARGIFVAGHYYGAAQTAQACVL